MPPRAQPEKLSGEAIVRRTPRVLRYVADTLAAQTSGDADYTLEAPSDLPMDEATFVCLIYTAGTFAEAAEITPEMIRAQADAFEQSNDAADPATVQS